MKTLPVVGVPITITTTPLPTTAAAARLYVAEQNRLNREKHLREDRERVAFRQELEEGARKARAYGPFAPVSRTRATRLPNAHDVYVTRNASVAPSGGPVADVTAFYAARNAPVVHDRVTR